MPWSLFVLTAFSKGTDCLGHICKPIDHNAVHNCAILSKPCHFIIISQKLPIEC